MLLQLYLHFPFCKRKCFYCDFCSAQADESVVAAYCKALEKEIVRASERFAGAKVSTVFLGGGTPTLVEVQAMEGVLRTLKNSFEFLPDAEFTSEGNPGTLRDEWLQMAQRFGLNRLSLGVQAAQDHLLTAIGRIHTFRQAEEAVRLARQNGVRNLNLDAMFGLPDQTEREYLDTLAAFDALGAEHISAYSLILEEGTRLHQMAEEEKIRLPDEDAVAQMYEHGIEWLKSAGYERYEVSNFAKPGYICRHNMGYWQGEWYLGLGVAAHSLLPGDGDAFWIRRANASGVAAYIRADGDAPVEEEIGISKSEAMFETMMLGLRTTQGVSGERFRKRFGQTLTQIYGAELERLAQEKLGCWMGGEERSFALTPHGIEVQNEVLVRLMK